MCIRDRLPGAATFAGVIKSADDVNAWTVFVPTVYFVPPVALNTLGPEGAVDAPNPKACPNRVIRGAIVNKSYACVLKSPFTSPRTS